MADDPYFGRMNDPTGAAIVKGPCGEEMEFYLYIRDGTVEEARYYTEGCDDTRICGSAVAERATGRAVMDALGVNPRDIIESVESLSEAGRHCAILAVSALYRAIANYLLQPCGRAGIPGTRVSLVSARPQGGRLVVDNAHAAPSLRWSSRPRTRVPDSPPPQFTRHSQ